MEHCSTVTGLSLLLPGDCGMAGLPPTHGGWGAEMHKVEILIHIMDLHKWLFWASYKTVLFFKTLFSVLLKYLSPLQIIYHDNYNDENNDDVGNGNECDYLLL